MIRQSRVIRPHNLDEYLLSLLKNIYKNRNLSVEVSLTLTFKYCVIRFIKTNYLK